MQRGPEIAQESGSDRQTIRIITSKIHAQDKMPGNFL